LNPLQIFDTISTWYAGLGPVKRTLLALATIVFAVELVLRHGFPKTTVYRVWTRAFEAIGHVWSVVLLSIVYVVSLGPISLFMRLGRKDPLDRDLGPEPSSWRRHDKNPLPPLDAARHQF
jgi:hypothetical protein